jgi:hypothetical protein
VEWFAGTWHLLVGSSRHIVRSRSARELDVWPMG